MARKMKWNTKTHTLIGMGENLKEPGRMIPVTVPDADRNGHTWGFGTTRVGKTRLIQNMVVQDLRKGHSVCVLDPKGDVDLLSAIVEEARKLGRENELLFITPIFPEYSAEFNPMKYYYMVEELVGHVVSGVKAGKEPFFESVAYEASLAIVQSHLMIARNSPKSKDYNLNDIKNDLGHHDIENLLQVVSSFETAEAAQLTRDLKKILDSGQDYYNKISSSLRVALMELCSGSIGQIVGTARSNEFIRRLESGEPTIFVVHLGSLLTRRAANTLGKVIISTIQAYIGRIFSSGRQVTPTLSIYMDEAQNMLYQGIDDLFAKAGGAGVFLHGFCQSVSQITAALGREYAMSILDNANTKIFMRVPDEETAQYVAGHFGTKKLFSPIMGVGGSATFREIEEDMLKAEDVLDFQKRQFYMMTYTGRYRGLTATVEEPRVSVRFPAASVVV